MAEVTVRVVNNTTTVSVSKTLKGDPYSNVWGTLTGTLSNQTDLQNALNLKVDKVTGKGLSTNDLTDILKSTYDGYASQISGKEPSITAGTTSQYWRGDKSWQDFPAIPTALSQLSDDATHRLVTDTEKGIWNGKQNALTIGNLTETTSSVLTITGGTAPSNAPYILQIGVHYQIDTMGSRTVSAK